MNQLFVMKVERIPNTEEAEVPTLYIIPDETVYLEKGYYHGDYELLQFKCSML